MVVGIIDQQTFGSGGGVETGIGGEQRQGGSLRMDFEGCCQLHGIVASQGMGARQRRSPGHQGSRDLDKEILVGKVVLEIRQGRCGVGGGDLAASRQRPAPPA
jgi:hypothetical protein